MVQEQFARTAMLYGEEGMRRLAESRVAVFGVGGVGGYAVEALARSGIGALDLIDHDQVDITNLNRQIIATMSTVGRDKVEVAAERIADIAPDCVVRPYKLFFLPETKDQFDFSQYDYVVDAIDTVSGKLAIIEAAKAAGAPVISAMGAGNKVRPDAFQVADIYETSVDPLARVIRRECRNRGIDSLKVVYSQEQPRRPGKEGAAGRAPDGPAETTPDGASGQAPEDPAETAPERRAKIPPGSTAFSPSVVGLIIAGEVVGDIVGR